MLTESTLPPSLGSGVGSARLKSINGNSSEYEKLENECDGDLVLVMRDGELVYAGCIPQHDIQDIDRK